LATKVGNFAGWFFILKFESRETLIQSSIALTPRKGLYQSRRSFFSLRRAGDTLFKKRKKFDRINICGVKSDD